MASELKPFGYAPGSYMNNCKSCGQSFMGDKRAWNCEPCAKALSLQAGTRPAPAATDTGLVTVEWQRNIGRNEPIWVPHGSLDVEAAMKWPVRELVTRSQAVELLAAERAAQQRLLDIIEEANDDKEALEAKLAAAEKALEPFVSFFNEAMKGFTEGYAERTPSDKPVLGWNNAYLLMRDFIEARAALEGMK